MRGKLLHAIHQSVFADDHVILCIHCDGARQCQFTGIRALHAPLCYKPAVRSEVIHPLIMRLEHDDVAIPIAAHAFGFSEISLRHLPGEEKSSLWRKFLHAAGHIDDEKIVLGIERQRTWLVELTRARAARADDFDAGEDGAAQQRGVAYVRFVLTASGKKPKQAQSKRQCEQPMQPQGWLPSPLNRERD